MEDALQPTPPPDLRRTLIFGNGGSGKTTLAHNLGRLLGQTTVHLDDLRWLPGQYGVRRDNQLVLDDVVAAAAGDLWVMEGVYGWLAKAVLPRATTLVWLDLPEAECIANVEARGSQGGGTAESFAELLTWIGEYRSRDNSSTSFAGHAALFEAFAGPKLRLHDRAEIAAFVAGASPA